MVKRGEFCYPYPRAALTTDCVVFGFDGKDVKVLLIQRGREPYQGSWAFPGGFLEMDETVEEGAFRELKEETGLMPPTLEQLHVFSAVQRDPRGRVITVAFYALMPLTDVVGTDDAAQAAWFHLKNIPHLAFDHAQILQVALQRLREKMQFEPVGMDLLDKVFTMQQLRNLYEAVWDVVIEPPVFQQKMLATGILKPIDENNANSRFDSNVCFRFVEDKYAELKACRGMRIEF